MNITLLLLLFLWACPAMAQASDDDDTAVGLAIGLPVGISLSCAALWLGLLLWYWKRRDEEELFASLDSPATKPPAAFDTPDLYAMPTTLKYGGVNEMYTLPAETIVSSPPPFVGATAPFLEHPTLAPPVTMGAPLSNYIFPNDPLGVGNYAFGLEINPMPAAATTTTYYVNSTQTGSMYHHEARPVAPMTVFEAPPPVVLSPVASPTVAFNTFMAPTTTTGFYGGYNTTALSMGPPVVDYTAYGYTNLLSPVAATFAPFPPISIPGDNFQQVVYPYHETSGTRLPVSENNNTTNNTNTRTTPGTAAITSFVEQFTTTTTTQHTPTPPPPPVVGAGNQFVGPIPAPPASESPPTVPAPPTTKKPSFTPTKPGFPVTAETIRRASPCVKPPVPYYSSPEKDKLEILEDELETHEERSPPTPPAIATGSE